MLWQARVPMFHCGSLLQEQGRHKIRERTAFDLSILIWALDAARLQCGSLSSFHAKLSAFTSSTRPPDQQYGVLVKE